jgi:hypothetical protein
MDSDVVNRLLISGIHSQDGFDYLLFGLLVYRRVFFFGAHRRHPHSFPLSRFSRRLGFPGTGVSLKQ